VTAIARGHRVTARGPLSTTVSDVHRGAQHFKPHAPLRARLQTRRSAEAIRCGQEVSQRRWLCRAMGGTRSPSTAADITRCAPATPTASPACRGNYHQLQVALPGVGGRCRWRAGRGRAHQTTERKNAVWCVRAWKPSDTVTTHAVVWSEPRPVTRTVSAHPPSSWRAAPLRSALQTERTETSIYLCSKDTTLLLCRAQSIYMRDKIPARNPHTSAASPFLSLCIMSAQTPPSGPCISTHRYRRHPHARSGKRRATKPCSGTVGEHPEKMDSIATTIIRALQEAAERK